MIKTTTVPTLLVSALLCLGHVDAADGSFHHSLGYVAPPRKDFQGFGDKINAGKPHKCCYNCGNRLKQHCIELKDRTVKGLNSCLNILCIRDIAKNPDIKFKAGVQDRLELFGMMSHAISNQRQSLSEKQVNGPLQVVEKTVTSKWSESTMGKCLNQEINYWIEHFAGEDSEDEGSEDEEGSPSDEESESSETANKREEQRKAEQAKAKAKQQKLFWHFVKIPLTNHLDHMSPNTLENIMRFGSKPEHGDGYWIMLHDARAIEKLFKESQPKSGSRLITKDTKKPISADVLIYSSKARLKHETDQCAVPATYVGPRAAEYKTRDIKIALRKPEERTASDKALLQEVNLAQKKRSRSPTRFTDKTKARQARSDGSRQRTAAKTSPEIRMEKELQDSRAENRKLMEQNLRFRKMKLELGN
jgi:hypothetical protein